MRTIGHLIAGESIPGSSGRTSPVFDPATGQQTATVTLASVAEVDRAVDAAREAA
ncbi:MAG: aldehyde dehydrogenase family protein, partial [Actinomyces sp.]